MRGLVAYSLCRKRRIPTFAPFFLLPCTILLLLLFTCYRLFGRAADHIFAIGADAIKMPNKARFIDLIDANPVAAGYREPIVAERDCRYT